MIQCKYCGATRNLVTEGWRDPEDGSVYEEPIDLCEYCVEIDVERSRARDEWSYYHPGEPCPESELPGPAPRKGGAA